MSFVEQLPLRPKLRVQFDSLAFLMMNQFQHNERLRTKLVYYDMILSIDYVSKNILDS